MSSNLPLCISCTDTLDLGKLESGHVQIERERFDLCELMRAAIKLIEPSAISKGLTMHTQVGGVNWAELDSLPENSLMLGS